ncbi:hypothetical protein GCM10027155_07380 [Acinetobacter apis]|uniref:Uncharacterized protein n=1 Tax=Acinetobacter apis TaxID=1229165 RepID=A0A217EF42_9GAMM|nr:hypothetical protein [Acinetobacter apis]SNQ28816.1 hypothetical protein SAMN05444584_0744 [Acinetobacter apis]
MNITIYLMRGIFLTFVSLILIVLVVELLFWNYLYNHSQIFGDIAGYLVLLIGFIGIGYLNARGDNNANLPGKALYIHLVLTLLLFISDLIMSKENIIIITLRFVGYFITLQIGVHIYNKKHKI